MQPGTIINIELPGHHLSGGVYLTYNKEDAEMYKKNNGGIIYKEIGKEIYRVFPHEVYQKIVLPMTEE